MPTLSLHPSTHQYDRKGAEILAIVDHATAGTNSLGWLISNPEGLSAHALIDKQGNIKRLVPDGKAAGHVGYSQIRLRQRIYGRATTPNANQITLGVEIENLNNGKDPYPDIQVASVGWLHVDWLWLYPDICSLKHRDIDTTGKSDPNGLSWQRIERAMAPWWSTPQPGMYRLNCDTPVWEQPDVFSPIAWKGKAHLAAGSTEPLHPLADGRPTWLHWPAGGFVPALAVEWVSPLAEEPPGVGYTATSLVMARSFLPRSALEMALVKRCRGGHYSDTEVRGLAATYYAIEAQGGPCAWIAAAQCCHETGNLHSAKSAPPQRNLAGIGATNDGAAGVFFPSLEAAARAQCGRLVAYALAPALRTPEQQALVDGALKWRPLPTKCQGSAPALYQLGSDPNMVDGCGWADPGPDYGERLAATANALVRLA